MKCFPRFLLWLALTAGLSGQFYLADAPRAESADGRTALILLTEDGPRTMTMAEYLPGAVAAEMPAGFRPEALRAQAVAIRTFALACTRHPGADLCADPGCCLAWLDEPSLRERWGADYDAFYAAVAAAAADTDGLYLTYGGQAIQAAFHASSAGATEDSANLWSPLPYLVSVSSPETVRDAPGLVTTVTMTVRELAEALSVAPAEDPAGWLGEPELDSAGRVKSMTVGGKAFSGSQLRSLLGLRSTAFTVRRDGDAVCFTVSGYGHGVGMSQWGANTYAAQGMRWQDILAHYYPGTELAAYVP